MKKDWDLPQRNFDRLLEWLDSDRDLAGEKYEIIRRDLLKLFTCRGRNNPEELADEAINRVASKIFEIADGYQGEPSRYFVGVARVVCLEETRTGHRLVPLLSTLSAEQEQQIDHSLYDCLEDCIDALEPDKRMLVLEYYRGQKHAKIENRRELADKLGITGALLRLKAHRIRADLQKCVTDCIGREGSDQRPS